jgi:protease I
MNVCKGMLGMQVKPDVLYTDVKADDCDAVVFVGGNGAQEYWQDPKAHGLAREADKAGKIVSAICIAPVTLANAGLLKGKEATVWPSESGQIEGKGARYRKAGVVRDGRIVTADGPESAAAFGTKLVEALSS